MYTYEWEKRREILHYSPVFSAHLIFQFIKSMTDYANDVLLFQMTRQKS